MRDTLKVDHWDGWGGGATLLDLTIVKVLSPSGGLAQTAVTLTHT